MRRPPRAAIIFTPLSIVLRLCNSLTFFLDSVGSGDVGGLGGWKRGPTAPREPPWSSGLHATALASVGGVTQHLRPRPLLLRLSSLPVGIHRPAPQHRCLKFPTSSAAPGPHSETRVTLSPPARKRSSTALSSPAVAVPWGQSVTRL